MERVAGKSLEIRSTSGFHEWNSERGHVGVAMHENKNHSEYRKVQ